jgi:predicted RNase H-like HicB family nuclease
MTLVVDFACWNEMEPASKYVVTYERDDDDRWVAEVRGLAGCHTQGRTIEQARTRIREAIQAWFDLPEPYAGEIVAAPVHPTLERDGRGWTVWVWVGDSDVGVGHSGATPDEAIADAALSMSDGEWCDQCAGTRWSRRWNGQGLRTPCEACNGLGN